MRRVFLMPAVLALAVLAGPAPAQVAPAPAPAAKPAAPANPVLAKVNGVEIRLSDVAQAVQGAQSMPEAQGMQPQQLYGIMLDRLISMQAVADAGRKAGVEKDPAVAHQIERSTDEVISNAYLSKTVGPTITPAAVEAVYKKDYAGKPGPDEVHAAHILVPTEAEAKKVIAELKAGGDFAKLAAKYSKEPGAGDRGGDLGWFGRGDMVPEFSAAAFSMKPGQVSDTPIKTQFGYHVIKVIEKRNAPPPTLEQAQGVIRNQLVQQGVQKVVADSVAQAKIERFNADGSVVRPTDGAEPPPAK